MINQFFPWYLEQIKIGDYYYESQERPGCQIFVLDIARGKTH
jgi:hypothetical protein